MGRLNKRGRICRDAELKRATNAFIYDLPPEIQALFRPEDPDTGLPVTGSGWLADHVQVWNHLHASGKGAREDAALCRARATLAACREFLPAKDCLELLEALRSYAECREGSLSKAARKDPVAEPSTGLPYKGDLPLHGSATRHLLYTALGEWTTAKARIWLSAVRRSVAPDALKTPSDSDSDSPPADPRWADQNIWHRGSCSSTEVGLGTTPCVQGDRVVLA